jgi:DNA-binding transcriptional ArsR family regulator
MTPIENAVQELRNEIEVAKLDLEAKTRSLKLLEDVLVKMNLGHVEKNSSHMPEEVVAALDASNGFINISDLFDAGLPKKKTIVDDTREVVKKFGSQEFNISHVESALKRFGVQVAGKSPKSRISVALSKLTEEGVVERTFKGAGNTPNRYKLKEGGSDLA